MIILKAPYPTFTKVLVLPNPKLGDSNMEIRELKIKRGMDGTAYSYAKTTGNVRLIYQVELTRMKSLELEDFIRAYGGKKWELLDFNDLRYIVIMTNTLTKQNFKRSWYNPTNPYGSGEAVSINLEFEGTPL